MAINRLKVFLNGFSAVMAASGTTLLADAVTCDLTQYKASSGLTAATEQNVLTVAWTGQNGSEMRARYAIDGGQPIVRELGGARPAGHGGRWGKNPPPKSVGGGGSPRCPRHTPSRYRHPRR